METGRGAEKTVGERKRVDIGGKKRRKKRKTTIYLRNFLI